MIAALLVLVVGAVMGIALVAGRVQSAGFSGGSESAALWGSSNAAVTGPKLWEELGFFATDDPDEMGLAYRLDSSDPVLIEANHRFHALYGDNIRAQRSASRQKLALVQGATKSTDIKTLPIFVEPGFADLTLNSTPLSRMITRRPIRTKFVDWNDVQAAGAAAFVSNANEGQFAALVEDTFGAQRLQVRVLSSRFEVTGLAQAAAQGFVNLQDWRMRRRFQAMLEHQEAQVVNGLANDANGWNGLPEMVTTNTTNAAAATITTDMIDDLFEQVHVSHGMPTLMIASHGVVNDIRKEQKTAQVINISGSPTPAASGFTFPQGMNRTNYNGIDLIGHDLLSNVAGARQLYALQMSDLTFPELRPLMVEQLAKVNDSTDWGLTNYLTFMDFSANNAGGPPGDGTGGQHHGRIFNLG